MNPLGVYISDPCVWRAGIAPRHPSPGGRLGLAAMWGAVSEMTVNVYSRLFQYGLNGIKC